MSGTCLALTLGLALGAGEDTFERWIHAQALRENLTVTSTGTLAAGEGQRLPYARVETPKGPMLVVEAAGARWALGPYADGTELLPGQLGVQRPFDPSIPVTSHPLSFTFRGGAPVIATDRFVTRTGWVEFDYVRLTRSNSSESPVSLLPVVPDGDETTKLILRAGAVTGEVVAHWSKLWLRSSAPARWKVGWSEKTFDSSAEQWLQIDLPSFPNAPGPFGDPLVLTLTSQGQRDSRSFALARFAPLGRWRSADAWVRRLEGDRLWSPRP